MILRFVLRKSLVPLIILVVGYFATATIVYGVERSALDDIREEMAAERGVPAESIADDEIEDGPNIRTFGEALWWCVVTASTVGYGDYYPVSGTARVFGGMFILLTVVFLTSIIGNVQTAVIEANRLKELGMDGTRFTGHLIVCGWSKIARVAVTELLAAGRKVAVITESESDLAAIRELGNDSNRFATVGDPTTQSVLERCNFEQAVTVIAATDDDTANLIISLNIRAFHPTARIIVYIKRDELRQTLSASGVTYVASPFEMSGRLVASAAFEPEVAVLVDQVTSGTGGYDLQQFSVTLDCKANGRTIKQIRDELEETGGSLLVAIGEKDLGAPKWNVRPNPPSDYTLKSDDILIVVGDEDQNGKVESLLGVQQGR